MFQNFTETKLKRKIGKKESKKERKKISLAKQRHLLRSAEERSCREKKISEKQLRFKPQNPKSSNIKEQNLTQNLKTIQLASKGVYNVHVKAGETSILCMKR